MLFNANLLTIALAAIGHTPVVYRRFKSRAQDDRGKWVNEYYKDKVIVGSWQPLDADDVHELQLDTKKTYRALYTDEPIKNVNRGEAPDMILTEERIYEVIKDTNWYSENGWVGVIAVDIGPNVDPDPDAEEETDESDPA